MNTPFRLLAAIVLAGILVAALFVVPWSVLAGTAVLGGFLNSFMCTAFPGARSCGYTGRGPTIHPSVRRFFRRPWMS